MAKAAGPSFGDLLQQNLKTSNNGPEMDRVLERIEGKYGEEFTEQVIIALLNPKIPTRAIVDTLKEVDSEFDLSNDPVHRYRGKMREWFRALPEMIDA